MILRQKNKNLLNIKNQTNDTKNNKQTIRDGFYDILMKSHT